MPTKRLPTHPDLRHLKRQARDLLNDQRAAQPKALQRIREFHPRFRAASDGAIAGAPFTLADAHLAIAREYGFAGWARLSAHVAAPGRDGLNRPHHERIQDPVFRRAVELLDDGDVDGLHRHLENHPGVVTQRVLFEGGNYFREPTLLEFVAENPVRHDGLPPNIVEVARTILDAGARADRRAIDSTLRLVCSGRVPRECGVHGGVIDLLCDYGADPNGAMLPALGHGEFDAADALLRRGAHMDLVVAAATGGLDTARRSLPAAGAEERHRALALAAQHGHVDVVGLLLDAGEDPNRYNPVGCHAHSTPLHQAALAGHLDVVRLLVERGARLDIRDIQFNGTPLGWAEYGGRAEIVKFLSAHESVRGQPTETGRGGFHVRIVGVDHVQLAMPAGREDEARIFYGSLLGVPEKPKPAELAKRGGVWFESAQVKIHLGVEKEFRPARKAHPGLLVEGLAQLVARLRAAGYEVADEVMDGRARAFVHDPFGNRLELIE